MKVYSKKSSAKKASYAPSTQSLNGELTNTQTLPLNETKTNEQEIDPLYVGAEDVIFPKTADITVKESAATDNTVDGIRSRLDATTYPKGGEVNNTIILNNKVSVDATRETRKSGEPSFEVHGIYGAVAESNVSAHTLNIRAADIASKITVKATG